MGGLPRWRRRADSGAAVFGFHNVVADAQTAESGDRSLHIAVADFRRYLDWIESAYQVVPLTELIARLGRSRPVGGLAVLSFDDAYAGFIRHGVPSLRERALPFVVFPVTDAATQPRPFWWDAAGPVSPAQRDEWLRAFAGDGDRVLDAATASGLTRAGVPADLMPADWGALRAMLGDDCTIGSHTVSHRNLVALDDADLDHELTASRDILRERLGVPADTIAYPYGLEDARVIEHSRRAGYAGGLTLRFGLSRVGIDPLALHRVGVPAGIPLSTLACWAGGIRLRRGDS